MFKPIGIHWYKYEALKYGRIPQYFLEFSDSLSELNASFRPKTDRTSHLKLPNSMNVSFNNG